MQASRTTEEEADPAVWQQGAAARALSQVHMSALCHSMLSLSSQGSRVTLNDVDAEEPDVSDLKLLPDTASLADKLKGCLQVRRYSGGRAGLG
jgi:hypothetical protein